jgi:hypothetical protein
MDQELPRTENRFVGEAGDFITLPTRLPPVLVGTAGVYFVMGELALLGWHAAATHGNAPNLDILVSSAKGDKFVAIQVKSASWPHVSTKTATYLDFPFNHKAYEINRANVFFAFVNFGVPAQQKPDVYLVPSTFTYEFGKPWAYKHKMVRFKPEAQWIEKYKNKWDQLKEAGVEPAVAQADEEPA